LKATLKAGASSLTINYDDFNFVIQSVEGNVYMNNTKTQPGMFVPDSCVITFGDSTAGPYRTFVPMTVLTPEVVL
jgi:serine/threonine-protein kinase